MPSPSGPDFGDAVPEVVVTNLKARFTGVSGTINALLPVQSRSLGIAYLGTPLPGVELARTQCAARFRQVTLREAIALSRRRLPDGRPRLWHVRRDHEMMLGIALRDLARLPIRLVFTSAAKHRHGWFPRWLISRMDGVVATTPEAAAHVPNTTRVVPHGISLARFTPPADKAQAWAATGLPGQWGIGTFGRVRPDKGSDLFVDAMIRVLPAHPEVCAVIAGLAQPQHQAYQRELEARIAAAGLTDRIRFLGEIPPDQVANWYRAVTLTVACPRYEPFGLTPLEGMACGCAVLASDTGAFASIVEEGVTGQVVPTDDVEALVRALGPLLDDPERTRRMGQAGRSRVEAQFSIEREAEGIAKVYETVWQAARTRSNTQSAA
jgi:mannosyltransferase